MSRLRRARSGDEGAVLILVMIVLMVFGLILGAVFDTAGTSQRSAPFTRDHVRDIYAADAGIEASLQQLRKDSTFCATRTATLSYSSLTNERDVSVRCDLLNGSRSGYGAAGYAAVILSNDVDALKTAQGASKDIYGPVFLSGRTQLQQPVRVHGGNVDSVCTSVDHPVAVPEPPAGDLVYDSALGYGWSPTCLPPPTVPHELPTEPCAVSPAGPLPCSPSPAGFPVGATCRVFLPGTYTTAPVLAAAPTINYFASGLYHFQGVGAWPIKSTTVIAGRQPDGTTPCSTGGVPGTTDPVIAGVGDLTGNGFGATFVFSGDSTLDMDADAHLEMFARAPETGQTLAGTSGMSLVALPPTDAQVTSGAWPESTVTGSIIVPQPGATPDEVVHGLVYTPQALLAVSATLTARNQFLGGVVVGKLHIAQNSSAINLRIGVQSPTTLRTVRLTSTASAVGGQKDVQSVATAVVSTAQGFPTTVRTWRSSAPDF